MSNNIKSIIHMLSQYLNKVLSHLLDHLWMLLINIVFWIWRSNIWSTVFRPPVVVTYAQPPPNPQNTTIPYYTIKSVFYLHPMKGSNLYLGCRQFQLMILVPSLGTIQFWSRRENLPTKFRPTTQQILQGLPNQALKDLISKDGKLQARWILVMAPLPLRPPRRLIHPCYCPKLNIIGGTIPI